MCVIRNERGYLCDELIACGSSRCTCGQAPHSRPAQIRSVSQSANSSDKLHVLQIFKEDFQYSKYTEIFVVMIKQCIFERSYPCRYCWRMRTKHPIRACVQLSRGFALSLSLFAGERHPFTCAASSLPTEACIFY